MTIKFVFSMLAVASGCICQQQTATPAPFACNLKALSAQQRTQHSKLSDRLVAAVVVARERNDGFALQVDSRLVALVELAQWVDLERKCCPFFDFELDLQSGDGSQWLVLKGREGVKQFIESDFTRLRDKLHPRDATR